MIRRAPRAAATGWRADERLSWAARGLLGFILEQPDNYEIRREELVALAPDGQFIVRRVLTELSEAGYVERRRVQSADGKWRTETVVYEEAIRGNRAPTVGIQPPVNRRLDSEPIEALDSKALESKAPAQAPAARNRGPSPEAMALTRSWWESQQPRPAQKFIAVAQVVDHVLAVGWHADLVARGLEAVPVVSAGALDFWRRTLNGRAGNAEREARSHDVLRERVEARRGR